MTVFGADGAVVDDDAPLTDDVFTDGSDRLERNPEVKAALATAEAEIEKATPVDTETAVAVIDEVKDVALAATWEHDFLMFEGDKLEVRLPSEQALSAFSIGVSKYMPAEVQNDVVGLFIAKHLSPASFTHVFYRMMDPDDTSYNKRTVGKLMSALSKAAVAARKDDPEDDEG